MKIIEKAFEYAQLQRTNKSKADIISSYIHDFNQIIDYIEPIQINKLLDIGCGIAGVEVFFLDSTEIYLIDKTQLDEIYYGFEEKAAFYNSLQIAKENLEFNGKNPEKIHLQEAEENKILFNEKFDLIISLLSCGFHYPIETYLDQIYEKLNQGGIFIADIRNQTNGKEKIKEKFGNIEIISKEEKHDRIIARK